MGQVSHCYLSQPCPWGPGDQTVRVVGKQQDTKTAPWQAPWSILPSNNLRDVFCASWLKQVSAHTHVSWMSLWKFLPLGIFTNLTLV